MKQILTPTQNGAENIRVSRLATRASNLVEDRQIWQQLVATPCSSLLPKTKLKGSRMVKDTTYSDAMGVGDTIANRIVKLYADHYNVTAVDQVTGSMIAEIASKYLALDPVLQLDYCRDPSRQSVDEEVQLATLRAYLPNAQVDKPTNGLYTLHEGKLVSKEQAKGAQARSVDFVVNANNKEYFIFAKYAEVTGSGQGAQMKESENFIQQAHVYVNANNDNKTFIVLTDGAWGESHIGHFLALAQGHARIFAGNCEQVINYIR